MLRRYVLELSLPYYLNGQSDRDPIGKARDGLYEPVLADSEREAVADLLQYLENVSRPTYSIPRRSPC